MRELLFKQDIVFYDKNACKYFINTIGEITMFLPDNTQRFVGRLMLTPKGLVYLNKRYKLKHLFRAKNAYGVNWPIVETFTPETIRLNILDTRESYTISLEKFKELSKYLNFKNQGFELQKFIEIKDLEMTAYQNSASV